MPNSISNKSYTVANDGNDSADDSKNPQLEKWKREFYNNSSGDIPPSCRKLIDDHTAEIRRLRRENYLLKHELKLLKRIIANLPEELAKSFIEKRF